MEVTTLSEFINDFSLHFSKITFNDNFPPAKDFLESFRTFYSLEFVESEISECQKFFEKHGPFILHLTFRTCDISERRLVDILKECENLQSLKIETCKELFMSGRLFDEISNRGLKLDTVTSLSLAQNRYLSDSIFSRITNLTPNLKALDLSALQISFHKGLYKKFYPASQNEPSESVLTFHYISRFIESNAEKLKELTFNNTLIDGNALVTLSESTNLHLKTLNLRNCEQLTNDGIISLIKVQTHLQHLDLTQTVRLTDLSLYEICEHLRDLKSLKLRRCRAITDLGLKRIVELENLEILDVSECELVTSAAIVDGIAKERNEKMLELYCSAMNICSKAILKITENFPNLCVLDLSYNFNYVNDLCVQMVLKNLIWLRELNLDFCDKVSDAGMTGIKMLKEVNEYEKFELEKKEVVPSKCREESSVINPPGNFNNDSFKISLRSKAEEEIINDARRKKAILEFCELNKEQDGDRTSYSIARLRGLRVLKLSGCNKISDISLKYNFVLPELKEISLARCHQVPYQSISLLDHIILFFINDFRLHRLAYRAWYKTVQLCRLWIYRIILGSTINASKFLLKNWVV
jgi:F-box/leucine-rich repeat protein 9